MIQVFQDTVARSSKERVSPAERKPVHAFDTTDDGMARWVLDGILVEYIRTRREEPRVAIILMKPEDDVLLRANDGSVLSLRDFAQKTYSPSPEITYTTSQDGMVRVECDIQPGNKIQLDILHRGIPKNTYTIQNPS